MVTGKALGLLPEILMLALKLYMGTSLVVQWLRCHTSTAGGMGLIPGWGTKIPHDTWCGQKMGVGGEN